MDTNSKYWLQTIIFFLSSIFLITNCTKDNEVTNEPTIPVVSTNNVSEINQTSVSCSGEITSDGGAIVIERGMCWSTNQNPLITDNKKSEVGRIGSFNSAIKGLNGNTTYYIRAYATNSAGVGYGNTLSFKTLLDEIVTDIDGNNYKVVTIGNQKWMAENLKVTHYNDGTEIPNVKDSESWYLLNSGALCDYSFNTSNSEKYGKLYNWYAIKTQKLAPIGWHVASDAEWTELENYLADNGYNYDETIGGGREKIAKALASDSGWLYYSDTGVVGNTDNNGYYKKSYFNALPAGIRLHYGNFYFFGSVGSWWTSTENVVLTSYCREISSGLSSVSRYTPFKTYGLSVRCIKD